MQRYKVFAKWELFNFRNVATAQSLDIKEKGDISVAQSALAPLSWLLSKFFKRIIFAEVRGNFHLELRFEGLEDLVLDPYFEQTFIAFLQIGMVTCTH
jgi:hypothetical protein